MTVPKKPTKPAAKKKSSSSRAQREPNSGGRPPKYDWSAIRREYLRGDDTVTYLSLSGKTDYPSHDVIKARAAREDWTELRAEFRHKVVTQAQALDLETLEEVRMRHVRGSKAMQTIALRGMANLDTKEMSAFEVARLYQLGTEAERKARGMEEFTVNIRDIESPADLLKLRPDQLMELYLRTKSKEERQHGPRSQA